MLITRELELRIGRLRALALQCDETLKDDLRIACQCMLDFYALSIDLTYEEAIGLAESLAMAHPDYEKASKVHDIEKCLKRFFMLQGICETIAGKRPWMRTMTYWSKAVFDSAMKPIGHQEWLNEKENT